MAIRALSRILGLTVVLGAGACASAIAQEPPQVRAWITSGDRSNLLTEQPAAPFSVYGASTARVLMIDPARRHQTMVGFGASITDASAWLIQTRLSPARREALLRELFGRDDGGLGFSFTRVTIGASDFSLSHYSLAEEPDATLAGFSVAPMAEHVFPTVRQALAINPELKVMASPWSAPGWMKTTGSMIQGQLKPELYATYADYFVRYIAGAADHGVPTHYVSIQNEPDFEPDSYPGMRWMPEGRAAFIGRHLGPRLAQEGLETKILDWDHNWDKPEHPLAVLADETARPHVAGVAWHCYGGDVSAQGQVRAAYPDKDVFFTECSGGDWAPDFGDSFVWTMKTLIIGATDQWARGVLMWNLALDENHGPHAGGCGDCRGVVTIDSRTGEIERNQEYYAFGHASRFVRQGARRVEVRSAEGLPAVAFVNPDGERAVIVLNEAAEPADFAVGEGDWRAPVRLPPRSAGTFVWRQSPG
jgi:glucosylceramidase